MRRALSQTELEEIRDRRSDLLKYHHSVIGQQDREKLIQHIDFLNRHPLTFAPPTDPDPDFPQLIALCEGRQFGIARPCKGGYELLTSSQTVVARAKDIFTLAERAETFIQVWEEGRGTWPPQIPEILEIKEDG